MDFQPSQESGNWIKFPDELSSEQSKNSHSWTYHSSFPRREEGRSLERNINKEVSDESLSHIRTGIEMETSFGGWLFNETPIELTRHARLQFSTSPCSPSSLPQSHPTRLYLLLLHANSMRVSIDPGHPCIKGRVIVVIIMKGRDRQISMQPVEESRQRGGKAVDEGWNNVK